MCGFVGWLRADGADWTYEQRACQAKSLDALFHRGPDDGAEAREPGLWMGFRRLAILDLSAHGRQPMSFDAGRYTLTFNGEIYNFRDLRSQIGESGIESSGDTAVLGKMLTQFPVEETLPKLRGMFSFAWWDAQSRALTLTRDPFGIKPLYYSVNDAGDLIYGSEIRAVRCMGTFGEISRPALEDYFGWGSIQAPTTALEGVQCLPPGHLLRWKAGRIEIKRWFEPKWPRANKRVTDPSEQRRLVREGVLGSVKAHLVSDVPVGVFLSGGLDSTLLTACMRELGQEKIRAFSIGYEEHSGTPDESEAAKRTADFYGCDFVSERMTAEMLEAKLDKYFDQMDQPTGDGLNTWLVSQIAAREVKVALSGLGADEWWAGYNHHRLARLAARSPLRVFGSLIRSLRDGLPFACLGKPAWKAAFYALGGAGESASEWQAFARTILTKSEVSSLLGTCAPESKVLLKQATASDAWLEDLLLRETETYLPNTLLRDNDVTSMAHSLELRVPFVDIGVFDLAGKIPSDAKLSLRCGKQILRDAFRDLLPSWINEDTEKKTFTLPLMKWMRLPLWRARIRDTLSSQRCRQRGLMMPEQVEILCDRFFESQDNTKASWHLSQPVWMLYVFEEWARRNLEARR